MKQENYGGTNYQTQTGKDNTNFFGGQHYHHYPQTQLSSDDILLEEYYKKAGQLISESYARSYGNGIDDRCKNNLNRLQGSLLISPEKTREINEEILNLCKNYGEPFKKHIQELESILQREGACSEQIHEWLEDCPHFLLDERSIGTACSLVGYQLYMENALETAFVFINKLINHYPDSPLAYVTLGLIHLKQGKLKQSLEIIRLARYFYEQQANSSEEQKHFEDLEQVIQQVIQNVTQRNQNWSRLRQGVDHVIKVIARFFIVG